VCLSSVPAFGQCGSLAAPSDTAVASGGNFNVAGTATVFINSTNSGNVLNLQVGANNTLSLTSFTGLGVSGTQIINNGSINLTAAGGFKADLSF
jgi:hypothetical protein